MRICFLAPATNYHINKWCEYFVAQGHEVHLISFINGHTDNVHLHYIKCEISANQSDGAKIKYLFQAKKVKKIIKQINPDVLNVHYATSYGAVAALAGLKNYVLSLWGSDIYEFPQRSFLHRALLKYSLRSAKYLFSTSRAMAREAEKYTKKEIKITPFGVKTDLFNEALKEKHDGKFIIGTVKALQPIYGIDMLLHAAAIVKKKRSDIPLEVRIAGQGQNKEEYYALAQTLGISDIVYWLGFISQKDAAWEWANMDLAIIPSRAESFGVSAIEAQACGTPVIITEIPGLMEATKPGESSITFPVDDIETLSNEIIRLYDNPSSRELMGRRGVDFVHETYEYKKCFETIEKLFEQISVQDK